MRAKLQANKYTTWQEFQVIVTICSSNTSGTCLYAAKCFLSGCLVLTIKSFTMSVCHHCLQACTLYTYPSLCLQDDLDVMFDNAMAYNSPDTVYHKQARSLKAVAAKMVELAKQGVTDFRSARILA